MRKLPPMLCSLGKDSEVNDEQLVILRSPTTVTRFGAEMLGKLLFPKIRSLVTL